MFVCGQRSDFYILLYYASDSLHSLKNGNVSNIVIFLSMAGMYKNEHMCSTGAALYHKSDVFPQQFGLAIFSLIWYIIIPVKPKNNPGLLVSCIHCSICIKQICGFVTSIFYKY